MFERLGPTDLPGFLRRYRLTGGRVRRVRVLYPRPKEVAVEFHVTAHATSKSGGTEPRPVRLVLRLEGVEEFRFQMRPNQPKIRIADARIGSLNGLFYVNFDAWALEPGEQPKLHDYRGSEAYAGGRELLWKEVHPENNPPTSEPPV